MRKVHTGKTDELIYQNLRQIQIYVSYYGGNLKIEEENHNIGILLYRKSEKVLVEFTEKKRKRDVKK